MVENEKTTYKNYFLKYLKHGKWVLNVPNIKK